MCLQRNNTNLHILIKTKYYNIIKRSNYQKKLVFQNFSISQSLLKGK